MLDVKLLRQDIDFVRGKLKTRGVDLDVDHYHLLEGHRKSIQEKTQSYQTKRNQVSKSIGHAKLKGEDIAPLLSEVGDLGSNLRACEEELHVVQGDIRKFQLALPNLPHLSVPIGNSEKDNKVVRTWGKIRDFEFEPKDHIILGELDQQMDFAAAVKLSGARFVVLRDKLARMQRALSQFMLDTQVDQHGYQELYVPYLVNEECLFGTGQLPKFRDDQFKIDSDRHHYLVPTGEVPLTNLARDRIFSADELPLKFVAQTPCFRSEAGSYGRDVRGMIRQHQFEKIELVQIVKPENSYNALEMLTGHAEKILQLLELPYRVVELCSGDLSFSAAKTYDLEVWLPGQNCYREISSCSNCEAFQARRMSARWRNPATGKPELVHTLNGSGLAIGRTLVAVMENYQNADGTIKIPSVLQDYFRD